MGEEDALVQRLSEELGRQVGDILLDLNTDDILHSEVSVEVCPGDPTLFHITVGSGDRADNLVITSTCQHCGFESYGPANAQEENE